MASTQRPGGEGCRGEGGQGYGAGGIDHAPKSSGDGHQYQGMFRGLGVGCKEPLCGKKNSRTMQVHSATHFAVGCRHWEEEEKGVSTSHAVHKDPEVVYRNCAPPDKNASFLELRQTSACNPDDHYRSEQRERYDDPGWQEVRQQKKHPSQLHFGDDHPELVPQTAAAHGRVSQEDASRSAALRAAGAGTLVPTSVWPKAVRCNPVTGGPRVPEVFDLGMEVGMQYPRQSHNCSAVFPGANVRDPIRGVHVPLDVYAAPAPGSRALPSTAVVDAANRSVPPLRSVGALRPPT